MTSGTPFLLNSLEHALAAADIARTTTAESTLIQIEVVKSPGDFATNVDIEVEARVTAYLNDATNFPVQGEEGSTREASPTRWIVDPVDGTFNFAAGIRLNAFSIALVVDDEPCVAVIDTRSDGSRYSAVKGNGAFTSGLRLTVSAARTLGQSAVLVGDFTTSKSPRWPNSARAGFIANLGDCAGRVRMIGTAATDLAWVAAGRAGASVIFANHAWDVAAGVLLVREAGGVVCDLHGSPWSTGSDSVLAASSPELADSILALVPR